jgi:biopolymer transport protein TolR
VRRNEPRNPSPGEPPRTDINVTPLVDVCLVLLIIFMVVTPMLRDGVEVALPAAERPVSLPDRGQIVVSVRADRSIWVNETVVGPAGLADGIRRAQAGRSGADVLLRGDRALPYGDVRAVFKLLTDAGVTRAALVTLKDDRAAGS